MKYRLLLTLALFLSFGSQGSELNLDPQTQKKVDEALKQARSQRKEMSDEQLMDIAGSALQLFGVGEQQKKRHKKQQQPARDPDNWADKDVLEALGDLLK